MKGYMEGSPIYRELLATSHRVGGCTVDLAHLAVYPFSSSSSCAAGSSCLETGMKPLLCSLAVGAPDWRDMTFSTVAICYRERIPLVMLYDLGYCIGKSYRREI